MRWQLKGVKSNRMGHAKNRIKRCDEALVKRGITFPPFRYGTINVTLSQEFPTPQPIGKIVLIPGREILEVDSETPINEFWMLIPIEEINGIKMNGQAYILRTETAYGGKQIIEILARDLEGVIDLTNNSDVSLTATDE